MSDAFYTTFKTALGKKEINLLTDTIVAYAVDSADYVFDASHEGLADLPAAARVAVSGALASKTLVAGVFDSANPSFPSVTGDEFEAVVLYDSTSDNLLAYFDGYAVTPNGNNIDVNVDAGGWFTL